MAFWVSVAGVFPYGAPFSFSRTRSETAGEKGAREGGDITYLHENHVGAGFGEGHGTGLADASRAAGDEGGLALDGEEGAHGVKGIMGCEGRRRRVMQRALLLLLLLLLSCEQTEEKLGAPLSGGCVRQGTDDAILMWDWAQIGTVVVVLP